MRCSAERSSGITATSSRRSAMRSVPRSRGRSMRSTRCWKRSAPWPPKISRRPADCRCAPRSTPERPRSASGDYSDPAANRVARLLALGTRRPDALQRRRGGGRARRLAAGGDAARPRRARTQGSRAERTVYQIVAPDLRGDFPPLRAPGSSRVQLARTADVVRRTRTRTRRDRGARSRAPDRHPDRFGRRRKNAYVRCTSQPTSARRFRRRRSA